MPLDFTLMWEFILFIKKENVSIIAAVAYPEHSFQDSRGATANSE